MSRRFAECLQVGAIVVLLALPASAVPPGQVCPSLLEVRLEEEPARFTDLAVSGETLVTIDNYGLSVWSLADPDRPVRVGSWLRQADSWAYWSQSVYLDGRGYAYWVAGHVTVFDVRVPAHPRPVGVANGGWGLYHSDYYWHQGFDFHGHRAARVDWLPGPPWPIVLVDFEDPAHPVETELSWDGSEAPCMPFNLRFAGDLLVVVGLGRSFPHRDTLWVCDVSDPAHSRVVGQVPGDPGVFGMSTVGLSASQDLAVFWGDGGAGVIDLSDPSQPSLHRSGYASSFQEQTFLEGRVAYVIDWWPDEDGTGRHPELAAVDLTDPDSPQLVAHRDAGSIGVVRLGDSGRLYASESASLDVLDRTTLAPVGSTPEAGNLENIEVRGTLGVLATGYKGIATYDMSDSRNPVRLAVLALPGYAEEVALAGRSLALVTSWTEGLHVVDVSEPAWPVLVGRLQTNGRAIDVAAQGSIAAVVTGWDTYDEERAVEVVDLAEPAHPVLLARVTDPLTTPPDWGGVALRNDILYVANDNQLILFSLDDPSAPTIISSLELASRSGLSATDLALAGDLAIVTSSRYDFGTVAVDVSDPLQPVVRWQDPTLDAWNVKATGSLAAISGSPYTLADFSQPDQPVLRSFYPMQDCWGATIVGDTMLVPNGPYLQICDLTCRPPQAELSWDASNLSFWFEFGGRSWWEEVLWDFGDGTTSAYRSPYHRYSAPGRYQVTLTLSSELGIDSVTHQVEADDDLYPRRPAGRMRP